MYSLFEGKVKHDIQLDFSDNQGTSPVRQIAASPNGKFFAVLTDHLLVGEKKLQVLLQDGKSVCEISMGAENIAVLVKHPHEYLLFNAKMQKIYSCSVNPNEIVIFAQRYGRCDKILNMKTIRDLKDSTSVDPFSIDVRASLLGTALQSQHLESSANVLKIAEQGDEKETCRILEVLDKFIERNHKTAFGLQILGLSLGFAGRAFKKFPDCATIFNLIFAWQELLPLDQLQPAAYLGDEPLATFNAKCQEWDSRQVLQNALIENCLPLGSLFIIFLLADSQRLTFFHCYSSERVIMSRRKEC